MEHNIYWTSNNGCRVSVATIHTIYVHLLAKLKHWIEYTGFNTNNDNENPNTKCYYELNFWYTEFRTKKKVESREREEHSINP